MSTTALTCSTTASSDDDADAPASDADNPPERAARPRIETELDVRVDVPGARPDASWLRDRLLESLAHIERPVRQLAVTIVGDERMRGLNREHRGGTDTTDVLSFEHSEPDEPVEADIVICADEAARRAAEMEHPVERELLLYALHGLLHCAGFDDHTDEGFIAMHAEEDRILTAIGVGATFSREASGHDERFGPGKGLVTEDDPGD